MDKKIHITKMLFKISRSFPKLAKELARCERYYVSASETEGLGNLSLDVLKKENQYGAHNYHPLPVALCKGEG